MTGARRNRRERTGNSFAFLTLMCGIASWVPLIVVITGPLTIGFFIASHVVMRRRGEPGRVHAAWTGLMLGFMAFLLQAVLAVVAAIPGLIGGAMGCGTDERPAVVAPAADAPAETAEPTAPEPAPVAP